VGRGFDTGWTLASCDKPDVCPPQIAGCGQPQTPAWTPQEDGATGPQGGGDGGTKASISPNPPATQFKGPREGWGGRPSPSMGTKEGAREELGSLVPSEPLCPRPSLSRPHLALGSVSVPLSGVPFRCASCSWTWLFMTRLVVARPLGSPLSPGGRGRGWGAWRSPKRLLWGN
jgi:hypothetical protein